MHISGVRAGTEGKIHMKRIAALLLALCLTLSAPLAMAADHPFKADINYNQKYRENGARPTMLNFGWASLVPGEDLYTAPKTTIRKESTENIEVIFKHNTKEVLGDDSGVTGVLLEAIGVYEPIAQWGGAGATVPLTGFGSNLAKGVAKAVGEKGWLGVFTGGLTATAGGIAAAVMFGFLAALLFKPGEKR